MPTYYGENAVLRLFPLETEHQTLASLGMRREHVRSVTEVLANSSGLVLVVGPTGSGKTTTLYTLMELVRTTSNSRTILTSIEDPVERPLGGIRQIPAGSHTGISFEQGLRAILRQDPDVIMVGELRDTETARLAIQAALTGHLVLSTLHALDIPTSIPRLTALGIDSHLLGSTLRILIAERLVRTTCDSCGIPRAFGNHPENQFPLASIQISGDGCASCNMTGYQGRTGVFDIATSDHPSDGALTAFERPSLLFREAFRKVVEGSTTCEEARRIEYA
jgi:type II secretory ATPase GspE/PulE/Tfp pilus assembly ATPase PilB-like protein